MRAVVQRVRRATVSVDGEPIAEIEGGLLVYLAAAPDDGPDEVAWTARKVAELRIFPGDAGRMDRSVEECSGAVLLVSQFTLYADTRRGRRPAFTAAAPPKVAAPLIEDTALALRARGLRVAQGRFAADMLVTIILDSADRERPRRA